MNYEALGTIAWHWRGHEYISILWHHDMIIMDVMVVIIKPMPIISAEDLAGNWIMMAWFHQLHPKIFHSFAWHSIFNFEFWIMAMEEGFYHLYCAIQTWGFMSDFWNALDILLTRPAGVEVMTLYPVVNEAHVSPAAAAGTGDIYIFISGPDWFPPCLE